MFNTRIFSYALFQSCQSHGFVKVACSLAALMLLVLTASPSQSFASNRPVISVERSAASVTEGGWVHFRFTKATAGNSILVDYTITELGDFLYNKNDSGTKRRRFESNSTTSDWISIRTRQDDVDESPGSITLTVLDDQSGNDYSKHATNHTATVTVNDDDVAIPESLPSVSASAPVPSSSENKPVFYLDRDPNPLLLGQPLAFRLYRETSSGHVERGNPVQIEIVLSQTRHFLTLAGENDEHQQQVSFSWTDSNTGYKEITLNTNSDSDQKGNGTITIQLQDPEPIAQLSTTNPTTIVVYVQDERKPTISIDATSNSADEGSNFTFNLTSSPQPAHNLTVNVRVCTGRVTFKESRPTGLSNATKFINSDASCDGTAENVIIIYGDSSASLVVATKPDDVDDYDGYIRVTVVDGGEEYNLPRYTIAAERDRQFSKYVSVNDIDNDAQISIAAGDPSTITEGKTARFILTSNVATNKTVKIVMSDKGIYISRPRFWWTKYFEDGRDSVDDSTETVYATFNSDNNTVSTSIQTRDDSFDEDNGEVIATLESYRDGYTIDSINKKAVVYVQDNDNTTVYIENGANVLPGSAKASFPIKTFSTQSSDLQIPVSVTGDWDFNFDSSPTQLRTNSSNTVTATIKANKKEGTLDVPLNSFVGTDPSGYVTATINSSSNYQIYQGYGKGTVYVNGPTVSISSISHLDKVKPGGIASFELTADPAPTRNIDVKLDITTTAHPFGTSDDTISIDHHYGKIRAGKTTGIFAFKTTQSGWMNGVYDSYNYRNGGTLTVAVADKENNRTYSISDTNSSATVSISDDAVEAPTSSNEPEISVYHYGRQEKEGEPFLYSADGMVIGYFVVVADRIMTSDLSVKVKISETSNFLAGSNPNVTYTALIDRTGQTSIYGAGTHTITLPANYEGNYVSFGILDDTNPEPDGIITLEVLDGAGYTVAASPNNKTTIYVKDDDSDHTNSMIAIEAFEYSKDATKNHIVEGKNALFWIHFPLDLSNTYSMTVKVSVSGDGNFLSSTSGTKSIDVSSGSSNFFYRTYNGRETLAWLYTVGTTRDTASDTDGNVTVRLQTNSDHGNEDDRYHFDTNANSASVKVKEAPSSSPLHNRFSSWGQLPIVSILAASESVLEGKDAVFLLESNPAPVQGMTVRLSLTSVGGDFIDDHTDTDIEFLPGDRSAVVAVKTIDDRVGEPDGSVKATIVESSSYMIDPDGNSASVSLLDNDDNVFDRLIAEANGKILPEVVRAMGSRVREGVESRVEMTFNGNSTSMFEIGGKSSFKDLVELSGNAMNSEGGAWYSVLGNSSFDIPLFPEESGANPASLWGVGDFRDSSRGVDAEDFSWDGDMFSGQFGLDARLSPDSLAGLSFSITENSVNFKSGKEDLLEGTHQVSMTSTSPYLGWSSPDGMSELNVFVSYGLGEVQIEMDGYKPELANSSMRMASFAGSRELHSFINLMGNGSGKLSIKGDALHARHLLYDNASRIRDTETQIHQFRLAVVSDHEHMLADGSLLNPSLSIGARQEGGDGDAWSGLEFGTLMDYENRTGLSISSENGVLFAVEQGVREWAVRGSLAYDRLSDGLGIQMDVSPTFGRVHGDGLDSLWDSDFSSLGKDDEGVTFDLDAEFGYGFVILDGYSVFTPFSGADLTNNNGQEYSLGSHLSVGSNASVEFVGSRGLNNADDYQVEINGTINW